MTLLEHSQALQSIGFHIVETTPHSLVGVQKRFHWDVALTKLTYVVFVREVEEVTAAMIAADRAALSQRASELDPSILPRGLQKGTAVITAYLAGRVTPDAQALCERSPEIRFAFFYLPAVLDRSTNVATYLRSTPMWGGLYFSKLRWLADFALHPKPASAWPVSAVGAAVTSVFILVNVALLATLALR